MDNGYCLERLSQFSSPELIAETLLLRVAGGLARESSGRWRGWQMEALVIEMTDGESCTHEQSGNSCGGGGGRPICGTFPETQICFCRDETASVRTVLPP